METTISGCIGTIIRIHSFIPRQPKVSFQIYSCSLQSLLTRRRLITGRGSLPVSKESWKGVIRQNRGDWLNRDHMGILGARRGIWEMQGSTLEGLGSGRQLGTRFRVPVTVSAIEVRFWHPNLPGAKLGRVLGCEIEGNPLWTG